MELNPEKSGHFNLQAFLSVYVGCESNPDT